MEHLELLLAAATLELAHKFQTRAYSRHYDSNPSDDNEDIGIRALKSSIWHAEHPVEEFVPAALRQLHDVAAIIRTQPS